MEADVDGHSVPVGHDAAGQGGPRPADQRGSHRHVRARPGHELVPTGAGSASSGGMSTVSSI